jgi:hypothetical protein
MRLVIDSLVDVDAETRKLLVLLAMQLLNIQIAIICGVSTVKLACNCG